MSTDRMSRLLEQLRRDELSRRQFMQGATAAGMSLGAASMITSSVSTQATPGASPVSGGGTTSITREEYLQRLADEFGVGDGEQTGGRRSSASPPTCRRSTRTSPRISPRRTSTTSPTTA